MTRIDLEIVRQRQQPCVQAGEEFARALTRVTRQIRSPDRADEQRIASQDEPRVRSAPQILYEQADALRRVARCVKDRCLRIAQIHLLAITERSERRPYFSRLMQAIGGASYTCELWPTGQVIRVHVRVDHVRDAHALDRCERKIGIDVASLRIDDSALT